MPNRPPRSSDRARRVALPSALEIAPSWDRARELLLKIVEGMAS